MKTDHKLKQDVIAELAWDPSVHENEIGVEVKDGIVTLTGLLGSYAEKHAAERIVQRVGGVKGVAVELDVRLPGHSHRTDADIASTARHALEWNCMVPKQKIFLQVENGWITLSGEVKWAFEKEAAETCLRTLMGVTGISNQIAVLPTLLAKNLQASIEDALLRHAHKESQGIHVLVTGNHVTLKGSVSSLTERIAACKAAASTPGVAFVCDQLVVA